MTNYLYWFAIILLQGLSILFFISATNQSRRQLRAANLLIVKAMKVLRDHEDIPSQLMYDELNDWMLYGDLSPMIRKAREKLHAS